MVYTSHNKLPKKEDDKTYCFLAGSVELGSKKSWRQQVIYSENHLIHFFDPTRKDFDSLNDVQMRVHIKWELDALKASNKILLNFLPDAASPISLIELGMYIASSKLIVVCPFDFYQRRYIETLCSNYNTPLFENLDKAIPFLMKKVEN